MGLACIIVMDMREEYLKDLLELLAYSAISHSIVKLVRFCVVAVNRVPF